MLQPDEVLFGYSIGIFPMAQPDENNALYWYEPQMRGILPLDELKISRSLRQTLRSGKFTVSMNTAFEEVMRQCAARTDTWISEEIIDVFVRLNEMGHAHSFETRNKEGHLVGGLYGVFMGGAFFGESMFYTQTDASKVALVELVQWMKREGMQLLDMQYLTPHLESLGGIEIPREEYKRRLREALL
ncbi:MAG: leucyl/phenylalanyl-tRNA--protein transferase [Bacteroidia bacterium]|jgi:leucyl/phenylalanyl-tRNA--protein transferase